MDYEKIKARNKRNHLWGDILGGVLIIVAILTGTAEIVAPVVIILWLWMMFSGNG